MRKKNYKGRCEKRAIKKCESICKTYDPIQSAFVTILDNRNDIAEIQCNVELDGDAAEHSLYADAQRKVLRPTRTACGSIPNL